jgi:hypothetical protein
MPTLRSIVAVPPPRASSGVRKVHPPPLSIAGCAWHTMATTTTGHSRTRGDDDRRSLSSASLYVVGMTNAGPLRPGLGGSVLRAWRDATSPCTSASGRGCPTSSRTRLVISASPRLMLTAGAKSFLLGQWEAHSCAPRLLDRTLLRVVAFRHSLTDVASIVCPTITVGPPARDPRDVCAASSPTTSLGNSSGCVGHRPPALLSGLLTSRGTRGVIAARSSLQPCLAPPTRRDPHREKRCLPSGALSSSRLLHREVFSTALPRTSDTAGSSSREEVPPQWSPVIEPTPSPPLSRSATPLPALSSAIYCRGTHPWRRPVIRCCSSGSSASRFHHRGQTQLAPHPQSRLWFK